MASSGDWRLFAVVCKKFPVPTEPLDISVAGRGVTLTSDISDSGALEGYEAEIAPQGGGYQALELVNGVVGGDFPERGLPGADHGA